VELSSGSRLRGNSEVDCKCNSHFAELYCLVQAFVVQAFVVQYLCWTDNDRASNVHFVFLRIVEEPVKVFWCTETSSWTGLVPSSYCVKESYIARLVHVSLE